jgi:hypothetical protein
MNTIQLGGIWPGTVQTSFYSKSLSHPTHQGFTSVAKINYIQQYHFEIEMHIFPPKLIFFSRTNQ